MSVSGGASSQIAVSATPAPAASASDRRAFCGIEEGRVEDDRLPGVKAGAGVGHQAGVDLLRDALRIA
jgi:hypothetical protein